MPNQNPIRTIEYDIPIEYTIPPKHADQTFYLSTITKPDKENVQLDLIHALSVKADPIDVEADPDIKRQEIGVCKNLQNTILSLSSIAGVINNGNEGTVNIGYSILFEAGNEKIDVFVTNDSSPVTFFTKIILKLEQ